MRVADLGPVTRNNRLVEYVEFGPGGLGGYQAERQVRYNYYKMGHVSNIRVRDFWTGEPPAPPEYAYTWDLALYYASDGKLWRALWDRWQEDANGEPLAETYGRLAAREFFYDGPRQRYLTRMLSPASQYPVNWQPTNDPQTWTDYAGDAPWGDFTTDLTYTPAEQRRYLAGGGLSGQPLAGAGLHAQQTLDGQSDPVEYLHGDLIDSTMLTTDAAAAPVSAITYTAFGELVQPAVGGGWFIGGELPAGFPRYAYAGDWGYESGHEADPPPGVDLPVMRNSRLLHVL